MTPFHKLTDEQIAVLTQEQLNDSIRVGALDRGIDIPITLPEAIKRTEYRGYEQPSNPVRVYCPTAGGYSDPTFGYLTQERAEAAMEGAVKLGVRYREGKHIPCIDQDQAPQLKVVLVADSGSFIKAAKLNEFCELPTDEFDKYKDACVEKFQAVRQSVYDKACRAEKRKEYLRLAEGNEEIAKAFYARTGCGAWPAEDGSIA